MRTRPLRNRAWLALFLILVNLLGSTACGRSRHESVATSNTASARAWVATVASASGAGRLTANSDEMGSSRCLGKTDPNLLPDEWVQLAPNTCYRDTERQGPASKVTVSPNRPASIELPLAVRDDCWMIAIACERDCGLQFDVTDSAGEMHAFAQMSGQRALLPEGGAFCSLRGEFHGLVARTTLDVSAVFHIAWYSYSQPRSHGAL